MNTRVMSFNIRCAEFTAERIDLVIKMVEMYKPSSVGFQEATDAWVETLASRLGDEYAYVSCGRDSNKKGEATPIFYLRSRYALIESGTKWMSETPDVPGSKVPMESISSSKNSQRTGCSISGEKTSRMPPRKAN